MQPMLTPSYFRQQYFPQLESLHWLASCSLSTPSSLLTEKMQVMLDVMAKPHLAWDFFESEIESVRHKIARLINAQPQQIALLPNASACAFQIISTLKSSATVRLWYCDKEFPSIANVWQAQATCGALISHGSEHKLLEAGLNGESQDLISTPLVGYLQGDLLPVEELIHLNKNSPARVAVDAYQALGVIPIDVQALRCDYLFGGMMKYLFGLPGLAFLYVRDLSIAKLKPQFTGWFARRDPFDFEPHVLDFSADARRFETGTPAVPAILAAQAGLSLLEQTNALAIRQHIMGLIEYAAHLLQQQGEQLFGYSCARQHGAHLALHDAAPHKLAQFLEQYAIVTSPRGKVLRLSIHYFNSTDDIDAVCLRLRQYRRSNR